MHPIDRLREIRILPVLVLIGTIAFVWFLAKVSGVLPPFLWALVTAYVLFPVVRGLERLLRLPRILVVSSLYLVFLAVLAMLVSFMGPVAMDQGDELLSTLPDTIDNARAELIKDPTLTIGAIEIDTQDLNQRIDEAIEDAVGDLGNRAVPLVFHTVEIAIQILVYFLVTFYFLLHGDDILRQARLLMPRRHRSTIDRIGSQVNATLGAYIRGQVILFVIMSVATYIVLSVFGVDYALALALATGALELIPIIGPWTAGAAAVTVAISQGHAPFGWSQVELGIAVAIAYFVLRMLEDHFVIRSDRQNRPGASRARYLRDSRRGQHLRDARSAPGRAAAGDSEDHHPGDLLRAWKSSSEGGCRGSHIGGSGQRPGSPLR
ncbi:MAG: AI-2E family transporter [Thermomicrobiales bacterium]